MTATRSTGTARSTGGVDGILEAGRLAGLSPAALAESFGTPFYVYDLDLIGRRVDALREVLPRGFRVAFAVKATPSLAVVAHLRRWSRRRRRLRRGAGDGPARRLRSGRHRHDRTGQA